MSDETARAAFALGRPALFLVYVVTAALGAVPALAGAEILAPAGGVGPAALEAFAQAHDLAAIALGGAAGAVALAWILAPFLGVTWLATMDGERLRDAIGIGVRLYPRAVLATTLLAPLLAAALALAGGLPALVWWLFSDMLSEPAATAVAAAAALPGLYALLAWAAWHDLARAALAVSDEPRVIAALRAGWRATGFGAALEWAALASLGLVLGLAGVMATGALDGPTALDGALALAAGQIATLAALSARGAWLASCLARIRRGSGSRAPRAAGSTPPTR